MTANVEPWSPIEQKSRLGATRFADVRWIVETGSTNADLLKMAATGHKQPIVLFTDHQTAGRGRQQRNWYDEPGDSLLVSAMVPADPRWAAIIPLATGLAAVKAVARTLDVAGQPSSVGLKWPNDVLTSDSSEKKLAGILVEARTSGQAAQTGEAPMMAVIGMGLNVRWSTVPPPDVQARGTTLEQLWARSNRNGLALSARNDVLVEYLVALDEVLSDLSGPGGVAMVLDRYRSRCLTIGRNVSFATSRSTVIGVASEIGTDGELVVTDDAGQQHRLVAGDAHHQPLPSN